MFSSLSDPNLFLALAHKNDLSFKVIGIAKSYWEVNFLSPDQWDLKKNVKLF